MGETSSEEASAIIVILICIVSAALASGLTQGYISLDILEMQIKKLSGTPTEKKHAEALLPLISRHHLLLVSLMLWNATAMEVLPLFLDKLVPEWVAIIISVTLVLFVGEILPAAILTGPNQLQIAYNLSGLVYGVFVVFFPIAYPVSLLLDYCLGAEEGLTTYNKSELLTMVRIQHEAHAKSIDRHDESGVQEEEVNIIDGVLRFSSITVKEVMTSDIFMLSMEDTFSFEVFVA